MTKRDILSLAFKVMSIYSGIFGIVMTPYALSALAVMIGRQGEQSLILKGSAPLMLYFIALLVPVSLFISAFVLLRYSDAFAKSLIKDDSVVPLSGEISSQKSIFSLSIRIIGVADLVSVIPSLVKVITGHTEIVKSRTPFSLSTTHGQNTLITILNLFIAIYLVLGAKHLVDFLFPKRLGGDNPKS